MNRHALPSTGPTTADFALIQVMAEQLVNQAKDLGVVVTIERRPLLPPAMGRHEPVITLWADRRIAG